MDALKLELLSSESFYSLQKLGCSVELLPYSDLSSAHRLETQSYPPDEACTFDTIEMRHREAGDFFVGCYMNCTPEVRLALPFSIGTVEISGCNCNIIK